MCKCSSNTHDPSDDPFDHSTTFHRLIASRDRLMSREKRQSLRSEVGAGVACLRPFLMFYRKYKWHKLSQGELQALECWVDRFVSLVDNLCRFILSALLHSYQFRHQLPKTQRDGDAEMLFLSLTMAACEGWLTRNSGVMDWKALSSESLFDPL